MAVTKIQNTKLSSSTATPAPNASSIWIELVAAVKVFEIEERREIAAGHALVRPSAAPAEPIDRTVANRLLSQNFWLTYFTEYTV